MENFHVKRPIYPLLCLISSFITLCCGLLLIKKKIFFSYFLGLFLIYCLFGYGKPMIKALSLFLIIGIILGSISALTTQNWLIGLQTLGRLLLLALSSVSLITLPPINLTRNLAQIHCPRVLMLGILVTLRFAPILGKECKQIWEAMKTRGMQMSWYRLNRLYRAFLVPFFIRLISISDTLSLSMETRGFELKNSSTSVYKKISFTMRDFFYFLLILTLTIVCFIFR